MSDTMSNGGDVQAKLAAARARRAEREANREKELELRELRILELEEEWEGKLGVRGEQFEIVDGGAEGPIVLKLGEAVLHKRFHATIAKNAKGGGDGITPEACHEFVVPCVVFPERAEFNAIIERRQGLVFACAEALQRLFGKNEATDRGKR